MHITWTLFGISRKTTQYLVVKLTAQNLSLCIISQTGKKFYGEGSFAAQPDQGFFFGPRYRHMYFTGECAFSIYTMLTRVRRHCQRMTLANTDVPL